MITEPTFPISASEPYRDGYARTLYYSLMQRYGLREATSFMLGKVPHDRAVPDGWTLLHRDMIHDESMVECLVANHEDGPILLLNDAGSRVDAFLCGTSQPVCRKLVDELTSWTPNHKSSTEDEIVVRFTCQGRFGSDETPRSIKVPDWGEIAHNYGRSVRDQIDALIRLSPDPRAKLILLNGPPGMGKAYAIRSLLRARKTWATPYYNIDPERFLQSPKYLMDVVGDGGEEKTIVLVMEDADEYVSLNAKGRTGNDMARMLNLLDGMLGQGIKLVMILTTNEDLVKLQPAMIRPGGCLANITFDHLAEDEATEWATRHGFALEDAESGQASVGIRRRFETRYSLAELFAMRERAHPTIAPATRE